MLQGIIASLVTNFTSTGSLDTEAIRQNVDFLARAGIHGVCIAGGTGEALALSEDEYRLAVDAAVRGADGRAFVVAGALWTEPRRIVDACRYARSAGATAAMLIPPYFVRPSSRQIAAHFRQVAETVEIPLILFNTPGRAGVDMDADLVVDLARSCPNIIGIKEASGDMIKVSQIISQAGPSFSVLQGLDDLVFPTLALGGTGALISLGTPLPHVFVEMYKRFEAGDWLGARELQFAVLPFIPIVYGETNPVGLKRLLDLLGRAGGPPRPPLHAISTENEASLRAIVEPLRALERALDPVPA